MKFISQIPWALIIIACVTLGLAPFNPPHVWSKFILLIHGELSFGVDLWDLFFHFVPWLLLILKAITSAAMRHRLRSA